MRVLVCGGRHFSDIVGVIRTLDDFHAEKRFTLVIHGAANGADRLADRWAQLRGVPVRQFPADWEKYGNGAGPIRNRKMLCDGKPDLVIAFRGGRGTADMIEQAQKANVEVQVIE
jgi:hypothetical protein